MKHLLLLALGCAALPIGAQPPQPITNSQSASETSRVSRMVAGPDGRPQALLLRNGTFVTLSPGLSQQVPATIRRHTTVQVSGPEYSGNGEKTIQARSVNIAGVAYNDLSLAPNGSPVPGVQAPLGVPAPGPAAARGVAPPPPPPAVPGVVPPPPPPPCGNGPVPPPPPPAPVSNAPNGSTASGAAPAVPPPAAASPRNGSPARPAQPAPIANPQ